MIAGIAIILATVIVVLAMYFGVRKIVQPEPDQQTKDLASSVLFRVSALHGLVLALVFASEIAEYRQLGLEIATEVNAVSDVYYDAERYGEKADAVRAAMAEYLSIIASKEWTSLALSDDLSDEAWTQWDIAYTTILDLEENTPKAASLRHNMLAQIHVIAEIRDLRKFHAKSSLSILFWVAALVGVLLVAYSFYTFPPNKENLILLSIYATYTGFILFTIYAMSNPFIDPAALEPVLFMELAEEFAQ